MSNACIFSFVTYFCIVRHLTVSKVFLHTSQCEILNSLKAMFPEKVVFKGTQTRFQGGGEGGDTPT